MTSLRKRAANQANAKKSTGPKSGAGKHKAAQNALRHGLSRRAPDPGRLAAASELAQVFCQEDPELGWTRAFDIAQAFVRLDQVSRAGEAALELALKDLDADGPAAELEDLARLRLLPRLCALADYEDRAAASLRKALRRL